MKNRPKEVDEFAKTEVLDRSVLESVGAGGHAESAALYEEYSRVLADEASPKSAAKKPGR